MILQNVRTYSVRRSVDLPVPSQADSQMETLAKTLAKRTNQVTNIDQTVPKAAKAVEP